MTADQIAEVLRSEAAIADRPGQYDRLMAQADAVDSVLGEVYRLRAALELSDSVLVETIQRAERAEERIEAALALYEPLPDTKLGHSRWRSADEFLVAVRAALTATEETSR